MPDRPSADLEASHIPATIRERLSGSYEAESYVSDFIYGAIDGTVTTLAVVAGVAGAGLDERIIILLGVANLAADGFSMAASNFLGTRAEDHAREKARKQEADHIARYPEGEREEIRQIFWEKAFRDDDLQRIVEVITGDEKRWIETMLREEYGYSAHQRSATISNESSHRDFCSLSHRWRDSIDQLPSQLAYASLNGRSLCLELLANRRGFRCHWCHEEPVLSPTLVRLCDRDLGPGGLAATIAYVLGEALKNLV